MNIFSERLSFVHDICIVGNFSCYFNTHYAVMTSLLLPVNIKLSRDIVRLLDMLLLKFCEYAFKTDGNKWLNGNKII